MTPIRLTILALPCLALLSACARPSPKGIEPVVPPLDLSGTARAPLPPPAVSDSATPSLPAPDSAGDGGESFEARTRNLPQTFMTGADGSAYHGERAYKVGVPFEPASPARIHEIEAEAARDGRWPGEVDWHWYDMGHTVTFNDMIDAYQYVITVETEYRDLVRSRGVDQAFAAMRAKYLGQVATSGALMLMPRLPPKVPEHVLCFGSRYSITFCAEPEPPAEPEEECIWAYEGRLRDQARKIGKAS